MKTFLVVSLFFLATASPAREWTNASDGKKIEADYVSSDGENVTINRGGKEFTLPLARLVEADRAFVTEQVAMANAPKPVEGPFAEKFTGDWVLNEKDGLPYAIFGGADLDGSKKYPLVLSLHGKSQNDENGKQIGFARKFADPSNYEARPCIVVAPLCYQPHGATGAGWYDEPGAKALALVEELIETCPIVDPERVYVIGYSMGGFGTTHLVSQKPDWFAAAVPIAGCTTTSADVFKKKPIWIFHAADDPVVEIDCSRQLHEAIERSDEAKYTEYESGGHGIVGQVLDDTAMHEWLFAQRLK